mmetsp:Transcript_4426/g.7728  ORF Transcript_4426/g.7728 Transcript_4426/m.7728 type:complete len:108 (-) Transcript_4426:415-738(-)
MSSSFKLDDDIDDKAACPDLSSVIIISHPSTMHHDYHPYSLPNMSGLFIIVSYTPITISKWCLCDGPVEAAMIEPLDTVPVHLVSVAKAGGPSVVMLLVREGQIVCC